MMGALWLMRKTLWLMRAALRGSLEVPGWATRWPQMLRGADEAGQIAMLRGWVHGVTAWSVAAGIAVSRVAIGSVGLTVCFREESADRPGETTVIRSYCCCFE